jgi:transposase-like protein
VQCAPLRAQRRTRDTRGGHYERKLQTQAVEARPKIPKLRQQIFETAIIEPYRRRESSVEEALIEMYVAGVLVRRRRGHHRGAVGRAGLAVDSV